MTAHDAIYCTACTSPTHISSHSSPTRDSFRQGFRCGREGGERNGKPVGDILTAKNEIGEDELRRTYAYILGIPFVSLVGTQIKYETLSLDSRTGRAPQQHHRVLHKGDELEVAMLDTDDLAAIDFIKKKTH